MARLLACGPLAAGRLLSCVLAIVAGLHAPETAPPNVPLTAGMIIAISTDRLDSVTREDGIPRDEFAIAAEGTATIPPGNYMLRVIADDGARVWVDGELVPDAWEPHESRVDTAPLQGGKRRFKVEYDEVGGFVELRFTIQRK